MQKIRIMTDSAGDIPISAAKELSILVLPIPIMHDGKTYSERVDMTNEQFYELMLTSSEIPTTAHITAHTYLEEYRRAYEEGYTHILNITINSLGSNMYNAACMAKRMFYEDTGVEEKLFPIAVIDSKTYTMAYGIAAMKAAEMAKREVEFDTILGFLTDWFDRLEILFSVYSLDFVKKSGRVNCAAAFVGELLGLRPVILFTDGVAKIVDKVRGDRNVVPRLLEIVKKRSKNAEEYPFLVLHGIPVKEGKELENLVREQLPGIKVEGNFSVGASIAINSGPKVVALVYAGQKRGK